MKRGFKANSERLAEQYRIELGLSKNDPLLASDLAKHLGIKLVNPQYLPELQDFVSLLFTNSNSQWSALTISKGSNNLIIYNPSHSKKRFESDVMHELAHLICKHEPAKITTNSDYPLPLEDLQSEQEDEAAWLGASLKLPRYALVWAFSQGMTIEDCSNHFVASKRLVKFRKDVTGIDKQLRRRY